MNNIYFATLLFLLCGLQLNAQQERQFTQFMHNKLNYNAAVAGTEEGPSVMALYRKQWINIDAAPETKLISFNTPAFQGTSGFGVNIANYSIGIVDSWNANVSYAYGIRFTEKTTLRIGIQGGVTTYDIDFMSPDIDAIDAGDPIVINDLEQAQMNMNFGAGMYLHTPHFYVGLSSPKFYSLPVNRIGQSDNLVDEEPHFYGMAGATIPLSKQFALTPALLTKYTINAPFDLDVHLGVEYAKRFNAGVSYRMGGSGQGESVDFLLFYHLNNKLGLGAAYDFSLSEFREQANGSIEMLLKYTFNRK